MDSLQCHPYWKVFIFAEGRFISWVPLFERIPYVDTAKDVGRIYNYLPYRQYTDVKGLGYFFYYRVGLLRELLEYWDEESEDYLAPVWPLSDPIIDRMSYPAVSRALCKHIYIGAIRPIRQLLKDYW